MRPADDSAAAGLAAERKRCPSGGLGGPAIAEVVFEAADEQGEPSGELDGLPFLAEGEPLLLHLDEPSEPLPAFEDQIRRVAAGVLRAQPVDSDPDGVERCVIDVRHAKAAHDLQGVHPGLAQDVHTNEAVFGWEEGRSDGSESRRDQRA